MKLVLMTYGTEGDTRPLAVLGRALMDADHQVHLLADRNTLGAAHALGVPASAVAGDIRGMLDPNGAIAGVVEEGPRLTRTAQALAQIGNTHAEAWLRTLVQSARGSDAIVLSGLAGFVGLSAAEALGIPAIGAGLIPITPTADFASPFLPPRLVPGLLHRPSHHLVNQMLWRAFRDATNRARDKVCGLPPRRTLWTGHPMLYGVSPTLLPRPRDWPHNAQVCGQWTVPPADWTPPAPLADFLAAGEPPVYVGFGSMVGFDRGRMRDVIVGALGGRRAVFYPGWSGIDTAGLPANIFVVGDTPHHWLFPRVSVVVHHGGSGTTHSATRAGVPSVVVPFAGDQPFWAHRLWRLGAAPAPLDARRLSADRLARAIALAERPPIRERARELGRAMGNEDGLGSAVAAIERLLGSA